ncbi:MAG: hypothetical protein LUF89_03230 [Ruminococcus sp.]|nr:hypothetical protein [Ruminococcus sp.]
MSHRLQKLLLAAAGSIFITLTFSTLSASAAEDSTEVLETTTLNRFVVSDGGNRVLVGSVSSDAVTQAGWYVTDDGSIYYYYEDGTYAQEETILADGYTYVFSTDGVLETGWQTVDRKRYYYNTEVGTPMFGWLTYLNQSYYVDENEGKLIGE